MHPIEPSELIDQSESLGSGSLIARQGIYHVANVNYDYTLRCRYDIDILVDTVRQIKF